MLPLIPLLALANPKNPGIAVLCYHDFQTVAKNDMTNTPKNFEAHMKWLKEHGYQTLTMDELVAIMKGKAAEPAKAVVLTFDDGYEGVYKYAYPVMKRYGFKGTLFLVTSVMGDDAPPMPHLTWPQIEEMDSSNVIVSEVHAQRLHIKMAERLEEEKNRGLFPSDIINDLTGAKKDIEAHTHRKIHYIAWPFGDYNNELIRMASKMGFFAMVNTEYGVNRPGDNVTKIRRLRLSSANDTLKRFEFKLAQYGLK